MVAKMKLGRLSTMAQKNFKDAWEFWTHPNPPTFGVPFDMVVGIAGGDMAIRSAIPGITLHRETWKIYKNTAINENDRLVGSICHASGT
jgi:N-acetylmuramic acid 6-phosphate (MurNAc-6-P) etherase